MHAPSLLRRQGGWIGPSAAWDLCFFFLPAPLALIVAGVALNHPALIWPLWWAWALLLDGPHLGATLSRTAADPQARARWTRLNLRALWVFAPGLLAWGASAWSGQAWPFMTFLLATTLWSIHHNIRQHYGLLAIYQWYAKPTARQRRVDQAMLYGGMWGLFALFLCGHPVNRRLMGLPQALDAPLTLLSQLGAGLMGAMILLYAVALWRRARRGLAIKPGLFVLGPVVVAQALSYGLIGGAEPALEFAHPEQAFLLVSLIMGTIHSAGYLGIVLSSAARRAERVGGRLLGRPLWHYLLLAAGSLLLYGALNATRGAAPGLALLGVDSDASRLMLALYWGVFFHHYYVDQHIWRVSADLGLRQDLGLNRSPEPPQTPERD